GRQADRRHGDADRPGEVQHRRRPGRREEAAVHRRQGQRLVDLRGPRPRLRRVTAPFGWPTRLHVVTGKGGTGKTTVAAALALALAAGGRRVLLMEVEGRQGIAQLFDTQPLPYAEQRIASAPGGGEVRALHIDAEAALLEYFSLFYNL